MNRPTILEEARLGSCTVKRDGSEALRSPVQCSLARLDGRLVFWAALSLTLVAISCAGDHSPEAVTPQLVLERAKERFASLTSYRAEYYSNTAKYFRGFLEETEIEATIGFQAPDRKHTIGRISASDVSGVTTSSFEEIWIGMTQYLRQGEEGHEGHWIAVVVPPSSLPVQENALDQVLSSPEFMKSLVLDIEALENGGEDMYKVSLEAGPGIALGFREPDRSRHLVHWISFDDYLIRKISYNSETPQPGEETHIVFTLSDFDAPVEIEPPNVTPVPLPAQ